MGLEFWVLAFCPAASLRALHLREYSSCDAFFVEIDPVQLEWSGVDLFIFKSTDIELAFGLQPAATSVCHCFFPDSF